MSNWITDLFSGKKEEPKEVFADRNSIIPKYLRKAALTEMETAEEDVSNDWHSRVHNVSDFVLAEQITELELTGKGAPEKYNAHWQTVMDDIRKNRTKAEERLLKLVPRHSLLDIKEFFNRIKKQNDKFEVAKDRALNKRADLTFTSADKLVAKGTSHTASVLASDVDYNIYAVKTDFAVNYYGGGDAHETFEKVGDGLEKEAAKTSEPLSRNVLEEKDASGSWQEVISSPLVKDVQIRAEYVAAKNPKAELRIQALEEPMFQEGETVADASGKENAEILQVDKENGMYVMKIPGFSTPVRKTFEKAHAGFHKGKKPYLPGNPAPEPKEMGKPDSLPKSNTEYITEDERAKLVKNEKETAETEKELAGAQEFSRHWQDLTRKLEDLKMRHTEMTKNRIVQPGMPDSRPPTPEESASYDRSKALEKAQPDPEASKTQYAPQPSKKLEPEGWWGWPNTERNLKAPKKHKKTNQGFELSLVANSLTLELPNGSFLTSVHANEQEAEAEFDKAGDLDSLASLFPLAALETFEKKAEDVGTGGPNMDGSNVMVDPQRGGVNQMGEGVQENPEPFKKKSDDEAVEEQLVMDLNELIKEAGGDEAVIQKAMAAGAKTREEIARHAVMELIGDTHEVDFDAQLTATGPNSSAQGEPDFQHYNQKFSAAEVVPFMEKALDEFLPEKSAEAKSEKAPVVVPSADLSAPRQAEQAFDPNAGLPGVLPHASLEDDTFVVGENVVLNSKVGSLGEGTEVRITGVVGASLAFEAIHDPRIIGITKFAKVDKQKPLEKYLWDNDGVKVAFELGDHVKVSASTFLNGKALKGMEGTIREKVLVSNPDASVDMFYLVEFDGAGNTTLPGECLKRGSTKKASFLGHKEATLEVVSVIVKRPNGWYVKSHKGKSLGGPYHSRERAEKRLQQVEMFKHMKGASVDGKPWLTTPGEPEREVSVEDAATLARFRRDKEIADLKKQKEALEGATKTAVMKPNLDTAQDFLDSFKIPPTVVSDVMIQEFLQDSNLHASKTDLNEIYRILQSSGVEVRISMPKEEVTAPTAEPAPEAEPKATPAPKKKSSIDEVLLDIRVALDTFHASKEYKAMIEGTLSQVMADAKEDPTDTEEAANGLKVGSKVQYTVKSEDELPGIKPGTAITGKVILMPIQHPEKDMSSGQPKEQGGAPIVTATVMWDKEELGTSRGLLPEELVKVAGTKYKTDVMNPDGTMTTLEKDMVNDMGPEVTEDNPDGSATTYKKAESDFTWEDTGLTEEEHEKASADSMAEALRDYRPRKPNVDLAENQNHCDKCSNGEYLDQHMVCRCPEHYGVKANLAVEAKGENAKIRELKKRLEKENKPSEISALINAIDALSGYVSKGKEAREKRRKDKADKATAATAETAKADKAEVLAEVDDESAEGMENGRGTMETVPEPMGDKVAPLGPKPSDEVKASEEKECCIPREPGFHNDECPEHVEWLRQQKANPTK